MFNIRAVTCTVVDYIGNLRGYNLMEPTRLGSRATMLCITLRNVAMLCFSYISVVLKLLT
jgi:hypothetical protein